MVIKVMPFRESQHRRLGLSGISAAGYRYKASILCPGYGSRDLSIAFRFSPLYYSLETEMSLTLTLPE